MVYLSSFYDEGLSRASQRVGFLAFLALVYMMVLVFRKSSFVPKGEGFAKKFAAF